MARSLSRDIEIEAPPEAVFALLADPRAHPRFDGSGTVKGTLAAPDRLSLGAKFGMNMRRGVPYVIANQVVEFEEDRRIAWRHFGHHIWRYELTPTASGGTRVVETFDWARARTPRFYELIRVPAGNAKAIEATLPRLKALAESSGTAAPPADPADGG